MPGIVDNCDGFYKVSSGDQCDTIAKANGISTAQLKSWNSEINDSTIWPAFPSAFAKSLGNRIVND
jgi:LysM repeat protein